MKFTFCNREYRNLSDLRLALQDVGLFDCDRVEREFERIFAEPGLWDDFLDFVDPDGIADELEKITDRRDRIELILGKDHQRIVELRMLWMEDDERCADASYNVPSKTNSKDVHLSADSYYARLMSDLSEILNFSKEK